MNHWILTNSEDGISIDGPLTAEAVADRLRPGSGGEPGLTNYGRDLVVLDGLPPCNGYLPTNKDEKVVVILRGDVVSLAEVTACPCGNGKAFAECHGAVEEEPVSPMAPCEHEKVYANHVLTSIPPRHPWVCRKCKARGNDPGVESGNPGEYERIIQEAT